VNPLGIFDDQREADPALLPDRERCLEEYSQAVHQYQRAVLALQALDGTANAMIVRSLLMQADSAREVLQQCQYRYYRALKGIQIS
jgi:hypothetical protein